MQHYYTICMVLFGTGMLGITTGCLGVITFLRKQSLLGDALSHAALPGIALMFLMTHSTNPWVLLCGGAITGYFGIIIMELVTHKTPIKIDAILGIILSVFFGTGLVLLTSIQKHAIAGQSILNKFLFGNASSLLPEDLKMIAIVGVIIVSILYLLRKELAMFTFDPLYANTQGFCKKKLTLLLSFLYILAIAIGLHTVGVILMNTMFIAPAAAARQWTTRFNGMIVIAGVLGGIAAICGTLISAMVNHVPTGPSIVIVASIIVLLSLIFGKKYNITGML